MAPPKNFLLALEIMPHLVVRARERRTITYGELGKLIHHPPLFIGKPLDVLRDQILIKHGLPRLDALVVNQETHEVGSEFYAGGREGINDTDYRQMLNEERKRVYDYERWDEVVTNLRRHYLG